VNVSIAGVPLPTEATLNFVSGVSAPSGGADSPATGTTNLVVSGSSGTSTPQRFTYANTGSTIVIETAGVEQWVIVDCTGGSPLLLMPTGCVDGQVVRVGDTRGSGLAGTWSSGHVPILSVAAGVYIANPSALGTFVEGSTVSPPAAISGNDIVLAWDLSKTTWSVQ
jgi:hypothetical protein